MQVKAFLKDSTKLQLNIEQTPNWVVGNAYSLKNKEEYQRKCVALLVELNYSQLWSQKTAKIEQKSTKVQGLLLYLSQVLREIWNVQLWNKDAFFGQRNSKIINYDLEKIQLLEERLSFLLEGIFRNSQLFHCKQQSDIRLVDSTNMDEMLRQENKLMTDIMEYIKRIKYLL